ncbi:hypothetical protein B0H16DRAFT_1892801 [Mycena metata]|uniref:Uncharacterized protein n=1 Tax=Mycena metata TaxID=1033252 RepID=A0AAD7I2E6_9AGAR|nr:hypothetical protein B0H16DRAFT_1892801 [Mycena metata]
MPSSVVCHNLRNSLNDEKLTDSEDGVSETIQWFNASQEGSKEEDFLTRRRTRQIPSHPPVSI